MTYFEPADFHRKFRTTVGRLRSLLQPQVGEASPPVALRGSAPAWLATRRVGPCRFRGSVSGPQRCEPMGATAEPRAQRFLSWVLMPVWRGRDGPRGTGVCSGRTRPRLQHIRPATAVNTHLLGEGLCSEQKSSTSGAAAVE